MMARTLSPERGKYLPSAQLSDYGWAIPPHCSLVNIHRQNGKIHAEQQARYPETQFGKAVSLSFPSGRMDGGN